MAESIVSRITSALKNKSESEPTRKRTTFPRYDDPDVNRAEGYCISRPVIHSVFLQDEALTHLEPEQMQELWERIEARFHALGWHINGKHGLPNPLYIQKQEPFRQLREVMDDGNSGPYQEDLAERIKAVHAWTQLRKTADFGGNVNGLKPYVPGFKADAEALEIGKSLEGEYDHEKHAAVRKLLWLFQCSPDDAHTIGEMIQEATAKAIPAKVVALVKEAQGGEA